MTRVYGEPRINRKLIFILRVDSIVSFLRLGAGAGARAACSSWMGETAASAEAS